MKQVVITEELINAGTVTHYKNDIPTLSDEDADRYIASGWAKDVKTGKQGKRIPGPVKLEVNNIAQQKAKK